MEATLKLRKFQENKWKFEFYFLCFFKLLDTIQVNELIAQISGEWKFVIEFFFFHRKFVFKIVISYFFLLK